MYDRRKKILLACLLCLCIVTGTASASPYRGWDYLAQKLIAAGVPAAQVKKVYGHHHMPYHEPVPFSVDPKETARMYSEFYSKEKILHAKQFLKKNYRILQAAQKRFHVEPSIITAILLVETNFGTYTGRQMVLNRLSRVATVASPNNVLFNYRRLKKTTPGLTEKQVLERALYLEKTFLPEIPALFKIASRNRLNIFRILGSYAGAFGWPQFLPSAYLRYGTDGNGDGRVSLFNKADAIFSAAHYLSAHGWSKARTTDQKKQVLWHYNKSEPYAQTLLHISNQLG